LVKGLPASPLLQVFGRGLINGLQVGQIMQENRSHYGGAKNACDVQDPSRTIPSEREGIGGYDPAKGTFHSPELSPEAAGSNEEHERN